MILASRHRLGRALILSLFLAIVLWPSSTYGQSTSFTYQGRLTDNNTLPTGNYDLQFTLWDALNGGTQQPQPTPVIVTRSAVAVSGGIFTVQLDFTVNAFPGADRYLEISVKPAGGGSFTLLSPRQQISSTPYAIRTLRAPSADTATTATTATNAIQLGGVAASQYVQSNDSRLSDARAPTAGSANYIQSNPQSPPQSGANFNISGNGTAGGALSANVVNATTQFNINGNRVLTIAGNSNLFAGVGAGQANTSGNSNVFVGPGAGQANTIGARNSFFGLNTGRNNVGDVFGNGSDNSFFGNGAGSSNTGQQNSFFGVGAGAANTTGNFNSFFGEAAGTGNTGSNNSFFGSNAGVSNTVDGNSFFGFRAGFANANGTGNAFFGYQTGQGLASLSNNSFFGYGAGSNMPCCSNNSFFGFLAGQNANGDNNSFFGAQAGQNTTNATNSFFGAGSGQNNSNGFGNSFFGYHAGSSNLTGRSNTLIGAGADTVAGNLQSATAIGANATVGCSHCMVLGDPTDTSLSVGIGTPSPLAGRLEVETGNATAVFGANNSATNATGFFANGASNGYAGIFSGKVSIGTATTGVVQLTVQSIPQLPSFAAVCFNAAGDILQCGGSSLRWKTNVKPYSEGLNLVRQLRPISFNWKEDGRADIGLGAEDVAKVAPTFAFSNDKGEITGVRYERLNMLLINAVKEQQNQIDTLLKQNAALNMRLRALENRLRRRAQSSPSCR